MAHRRARCSSDDDAIDLVLFDIGGVLGSNGWDREQRDGRDRAFRPRRRRLSVSPRGDGRRARGPVRSRSTSTCGSPVCWRRELLVRRVQVVHVRSRASRGPTASPWRESWPTVGLVRMATLNNEGEELNIYRIETVRTARHFPDVLHVVLARCPEADARDLRARASHDAG